MLTQLLRFFFQKHEPILPNQDNITHTNLLTQWWCRYQQTCLNNEYEIAHAQEEFDNEVCVLLLLGVLLYSTLYSFYSLPYPTMYVPNLLYVP